MLLHKNFKYLQIFHFFLIGEVIHSYFIFCQLAPKLKYQRVDMHLRNDKICIYEIAMQVKKFNNKNFGKICITIRNSRKFKIFQNN